jgi:hypothetical protein
MAVPDLTEVKLGSWLTNRSAVGLLTETGTLVDVLGRKSASPL